MSSTGRVLWIIWCLSWAGFWFFAGLATLGIAWLGIPAALLCILIPVGSPPKAAAVPPGQEPWRQLPPGPGGYR